MSQTVRISSIQVERYGKKVIVRVERKGRLHVVCEFEKGDFNHRILADSIRAMTKKPK